jgi:MFS family permease
MSILKGQTAMEYLLTYGWAVLIVGIILFILLVPFLLIAAANTLFTLKIPFNLATWFAAVVLMLFIGGYGMITGLGSSLKESKFGFLFVLLMLIFIVGIVLGPLLFIWSLNELFDLGIHYTIWTWLAALVIGIILGIARSVSSGSARNANYQSKDIHATVSAADARVTKPKTRKTAKRKTGK